MHTDMYSLFTILTILSFTSLTTALHSMESMDEEGIRQLQKRNSKVICIGGGTIQCKGKEQEVKLWVELDSFCNSVCHYQQIQLQTSKEEKYQSTADTTSIILSPGVEQQIAEAHAAQQILKEKQSLPHQHEEQQIEQMHPPIIGTESFFAEISILQKQMEKECTPGLANKLSELIRQFQAQESVRIESELYHKKLADEEKMSPMNTKTNVDIAFESSNKQNAILYEQLFNTLLDLKFRYEVSEQHHSQHAYGHQFTQFPKLEGDNFLQSICTHVLGAIDGYIYYQLIEEEDEMYTKSYGKYSTGTAIPPIYHRRCDGLLSHYIPMEQREEAPGPGSAAAEPPAEDLPHESVEPSVVEEQINEYEYLLQMMLYLIRDHEIVDQNVQNAVGHENVVHAITQVKVIFQMFHFLNICAEFINNVNVRSIDNCVIILADDAKQIQKQERIYLPEIQLELNTIEEVNEEVHRIMYSMMHMQQQQSYYYEQQFSPQNPGQMAYLQQQQMQHPRQQMSEQPMTHMHHQQMQYHQSQFPEHQPQMSRMPQAWEQFNPYQQSFQDTHNQPERYAEHQQPFSGHPQSYQYAPYDEK